MDFSQDLENCLDALRTGGLIGIPTVSGRMVAADATLDDAVNALREGSQGEMPVVLLADERDLLQYVSALDLDVFDRFESFELPTAIRFEGIIGLADALTGPEGTACIALIADDFCRHLVKRFRKPLAVLPEGNGPHWGTILYRAADHTNALADRFRLI
ncbi:Sua5/YciO/YrdC/YwlC family protein [Flavihumibacter rivuli]|uniref:Sua5/YciO/YrdC/YwlC family protein n=1 Tax=Flavihumibacter rivuli TaxID=2838156 RepID=UPI001BDE1A64|nr:Sua5/YciO/YrdC/YwlC family protein [Flavihumibacter rivuli]ULQ57193.1 Sua5/YciO/YrdC/YwlC family protein [Flavihumibacter rivuli]